MEIIACEPLAETSLDQGQQKLPIPVDCHDAEGGEDEEGAVCSAHSQGGIEAWLHEAERRKAQEQCRSIRQSACGHP